MICCRRGCPQLRDSILYHVRKCALAPYAFCNALHPPSFRHPSGRLAIGMGISFNKLKVGIFLFNESRYSDYLSSIPDDGGGQQLQKSIPWLTECCHLERTYLFAQKSNIEHKVSHTHTHTHCSVYIYSKFPHLSGKISVGKIMETGQPRGIIMYLKIETQQPPSVVCCASEME